MESAYDLFRNGTELLDGRDFHAAAVPLRRAAELEPDKMSVREALGRAYFGSQRYREGAAEFGAVVAREPTNDYAHFCLGRCLQSLGDHARARAPLTMAARLRPDRSDYRVYLERSVRAAEAD
jgi:tetratricopeptide (TPR) repeat protein